MTETIWIVTQSEDMMEGQPVIELLRAFRTADAAKAYIGTLPKRYLIEYDWESVELERVEGENK